LDLNNFTVMLFCYVSNQWGIYDATVSQDCKGFHFIGLFAQKIGVSGSGCSEEYYDVTEIGCKGLEISGTETCDQFKEARIAANFGLSFVSALLIFAVFNMHYARKGTHNKTLWISLLLCFVGNCSVVIVSFVTFTAFRQSIIHDGLDIYPYDFEEGDCMKLMIYLGTMSIVSAAVTLRILTRGGLCCGSQAQKNTDASKM
jgi:hypothetical protein